MRTYDLHLNLNNFKVTGFYPYTSGTVCRFLEQNHNYKTDEHDFLQEFGAKVKLKAEAKGCHWDNKVVVELTSTNPSVVTPKIYVGQYDNLWSIGCGVWQDEWLKDSNLHFE